MPAIDEGDRMNRRTLAIGAVLLAAGPAARAHGEAHRATDAPVVKEQKPWGIAAERREARRTIEVGMGDDMRFRPARFVIRNRGRVLHEFVLSTPAELAEHAALMRKHPGMEHDEPSMAHVPPGKTGEIVWTFNRTGEFDFACLIPGHFDAGMVGRIVVAPGAAHRRYR
jgi:uncharacterized cupredoxin-like copper-binding protein